jgi:hypothetical protein
VGFKDLMGKVEDLGNTAIDTASKFLDEFNEALPTMRALGFTIRDFKMAMALVPEVSAKLVGSVDTIDVKRIDSLIVEHKEKKLLVAFLKAIEAAYHLKEQLGETSFKSIEMDVTLGFPPHVNVAFGSKETAAPVTAGAAHA